MLKAGNTAILVSKPTGYESQHIPLTVGREYTILDVRYPEIVIEDDAGDEASVYHQRFQIVASK
jgi:hypothetical protein